MNKEVSSSSLGNSREGTFRWQQIWQLKLENKYGAESAEQDPDIFLWLWWSARNKAIAQNRMASAAEICSSVLYYLMEGEKCQGFSEPTKPRKVIRWKPPPVDYYKDTNKGGWGYVIRDSKRDVLEVGAGKLQWPHIPCARTATTHSAAHISSSCLHLMPARPLHI
uniref:Uncharacterized protein n=1 Tax=Oryza punctata TaxID=4537 RepID=A0A0E0JS96_ORYPU